jgi:hypothetical protein
MKLKIPNKDRIALALEMVCGREFKSNRGGGIARHS